MFSTAGRSKFVLSASLLAALAAAGNPVRASDVSAGLKHYNQGNFEAARKEFQRALVANKEDPRLHYCLANALMHLKKVPEALREYHLCMHYGDGTIIAEESQTAIDTYERHAQPFDRERAARERSESEYRREEEQRQKASELIHKQSQIHSGLRASESEAQKNSLLSKANEDAKRIRDNANSDAANASYYTYRRRYWSQQNADAIRKQGQADADAVLKRAQQQADNYEREARERQARMSEAENNLNEELLHPSAGGKIHLSPEGTNLYIRNYR